ncbi:hypothetical protein AMATHDRAFT_84522 [Amanita thiersii Skay4041]|uniref:E2 ubiquitin-conjugating enzyme n=1 Tax=Amanita thiersii Skay4041 TaxID=703135 RepID=A0A2A9NN70_9AGAR|nr:hypothetical protein AMATHDRAFT_84522 [Amanita thiersii Skay4041]
MSAATLRRVQKELAEITNNPIDGVTAEPQEANVLQWKCTIKASPDSPYRSGTFHFDLTLPQSFPFKPPTVTFTTKIYHPGINEEGAICVPVLREEWKPTVTLSSVLAIIQEKLNNPNADDPFEPEIAAQLKNEKQKFLAIAREYTKKYAIKRSDAQPTSIPFPAHIQTSQPEFQGQTADRLNVTTLPEIPRASDFRTSLILTDLAKRFSLLRSPKGEPFTVEDLRYRLAEQRARGAKNQITEEEEDMLLETLGRMRSKTNALSAKSQENVAEVAEPPANTASTQSLLTSSPSGRSTKRYSNNLFGSGRLRDYTYFKHAATSHGRTGSKRAPSLTPTETSVSIQEVTSLPDSIRPTTPENVSLQSTSEIFTNRVIPVAITSEEPNNETPSTVDSLLLKRASSALADAIKEIEEETDDEIVMPRLARSNPDQSSRLEQAIANLAKSSQISLQSQSIIEAGMAISSDKQVLNAFEDHRVSPLPSRTLPGYVPGMPRPMTPRDAEIEEQRSLSTTPRAMSPVIDSPSNLPPNVTRRGSVSSATRQSPRPTSPQGTLPRPSTPSRSATLFLQRSPSGRRTPDNSSRAGDPIEFNSPLSSSIMSKRRPASPLSNGTFQSMSVSSRPSTPSNIVWNVNSRGTTQKSHGHERNGSLVSDSGTSDTQSADTLDAESASMLDASRLSLQGPSPPDLPSTDYTNGMDMNPTNLGVARVPRSPTPTRGSPRSPAFPDASPRNGSSRRSSRQNTSSPFHFNHYPPLVLLPVVSSSRSSLESVGSSFHSWDGEKDRCLSIFSDADVQQPAWHDIPMDRSSSFDSQGSLNDDEWDPEEIIGRYAGLKKSDFVTIQEKLVSISLARDDARERAPSIRRRRPSTSQSNYSTSGRERVASPPASPTTATPEQYAKATAVLNAMADSIQTMHIIDTSVHRAPDTEPSPNTRRNRDLAQALFGDEIQKEREQTPKPVPIQVPEPEPTTNRDSECLTETEVHEEQGGSSTAAPSASPYPMSKNISSSGIQQVVQDEVELEKEVQKKAAAATLALRKQSGLQTERTVERSHFGSISRRRINPSHISEPHLVSASTSVDTIPIRSSAPSTANPGTSKIGSRFRKLRGTLRAKNAQVAVSDESTNHTESSVSPVGQVITYDAAKLGSASGIMSATEGGRSKVQVSSPPASAGPGLKGFISRFRSKRVAESSSSDRRNAAQAPSPSTPLLSSQTDRAALPPSTPNNGGSEQALVQEPRQAQSPIPERETTETPDRNELALRQLFDAASDLGLDQNALNALLARTPSLTKTMETTPERRNPKAESQAKHVNDVQDTQPPISRISGSNFEQGSSARITTNKSGGSRRSQDHLLEGGGNSVVRRTIIYPSDIKGSPLDPSTMMRKNSRRRRLSANSASNKSIQERVPTPPPPRSPGLKTFATEMFPPVPQLPRSLMPTAEQTALVPGSSGEKSSSAYESLYEMYSEDNRFGAYAGHDGQSQAQSSRDTNANTDAPALELIELSNGQTIWSIVNGLRSDDDESFYAGRTSFGSEYSTRESNTDGGHLYVKEHRKTGSKGSASSFASRQRVLQGKMRPETKVYYSTPAHIGRLIENLSQGMDTSSFNLPPNNNRGPSHSPSSSFSLTGSTNDGHWTIEERLEHMLDTINR